MGRKKTAGDVVDTGAPAAAKKSRSNMLPAVVVAAGLLGGGYFMSSGGGAKATAATTATTAGSTEGAAAKTTKTTEDPVPKGEIVKLDPITLNLADGRFVKLGLALQLSEKAKAGDEATGFSTKAARALDLAISSLGDYSYADLSAPGGRERAKEDLKTKVVAAYGGDVTGIYFTEFVMQ